MGFFNKARIAAMFSGDYICDECHSKMEFEDENEDTLVCPACGYSTDLDHYGFEDGESYEDQYLPPIEEVMENDENDDEYYDEFDD